MRIFLAFIALFLLTARPAFADCGNPAGVAGELIYNADYNTMQFCDGADWIRVPGAGLDCPEGNILVMGNNGWVCSCNPLPGPVAHWKLNEWGGTTAHDSAGTNDGTLQGGPVFTSAGKIGNALEFSGGAQVEISDNAALDISNAVSVSAWVKPTAPNPNFPWWAIACKSCTGDGYGLYIEHGSGAGPGDFRFEVDTDGGTRWPIGGPGISTFYNQWVHVAGTYDSSSGDMKLYVNGAEVNTSNIGAGKLIDLNDQPLKIGDRQGDAETLYVDDVRIYNRALSASEISALYNGGAGCP